MLSSIHKLSRYTDLDIEAANDKLSNRRKLLGWQASVSQLVESYCHRKFIIEARTEKFNVEPQQRTFPVLGVPIVSVANVKVDTMGRFDGTSDYTLSSDDYRIGVDGMSVVLNDPPPPGLGVVQITYTGGLAYNATRSIFAGTISGVSDDWFCTNEYGSAVGIVRDSDSDSIEIENLYGVFGGTDTLSFATKEESLFGTSTTLQASASAVLTSITQQSLSELCPDLERAVEIEVRYMAQHQKDFENVSTLQDQTQRRQHTVFQREYVFQQETLAILGRYRRIIL